MAGFRRGLVLIAVACVVLTGCTSTTATEPTASLPASRDYDLFRIAKLDIALPPGFTPAPTPATVAMVQRRWADSVGAAVSYGSPFTVDPAECRPLLKQVDVYEGADSIGIRNDGPHRGGGISLSAYDPVTVPATIPSTGCDRMTYAVNDAAVPTSGTVERIAAPEIDGATTVALKVEVNGFPDDDYYYSAILEDRVFVNVQARVDPSFQAQPILPDMLVDAVAAIRGK
jgi:hypothetical protein